MIRILALVAAAGIELVAVWSAWVEPHRFTLRQSSIEPADWPADLAPLTVALLSDLHVGSPSVSLQALSNIVERVNAAAPDIIVLAGDFVLGQPLIGSKRIDPEPIAGVLAGLQAPHGVYAVLGNHDWWFGGARVAQSLEAAGIVVLENRAVEIDVGGASVWVAGIADTMTRAPDVAGTLRQVRAGEAAIVAMHNPAAFAAVLPGPRALCGGRRSHARRADPPAVRWRALGAEPGAEAMDPRSHRRRWAPPDGFGRARHQHPAAAVQHSA